MENPVPYGDTPLLEIRKTCLKPFAEWEPPTTDEIRTAMKIAGVTGSELAQLVGVQNSRTVRRWTGGDLEIPYSAWAILCHQAGFGIIWK